MAVTDLNLALSPVYVSVNSHIEPNPYGLRGMMLLNESDHESIQSYRSMAQVEQDYDIDTNIWKHANAYFTALDDDNGLVQVINYDRNYHKPTASNTTNPNNGTSANQTFTPGGNTNTANTAASTPTPTSTPSQNKGGE